MDTGGSYCKMCTLCNVALITIWWCFKKPIFRHFANFPGMLANTGFATKWMRNEYYSYSHWIPHENEFNNVLCFMLLKFTFELCQNSIMSCVVRHAANSFIIFASTWILSYILGYWKMDIWKWDIYKSGCFLFRQKWCWCDSDMFGYLQFLQD